MPALEHPRLFLTQQRLRLLKRERERRSPRWQQLELLVSGRARMPEEGFALALFYQVSGNRETGRRAVEWALSPAATDLRQIALVLDWCQPELDDQRASALGAKVQRALERPPQSRNVPEARSRTLAALAIADSAPKLAEAELRRIVVAWWRGEIVPRLKAGGDLLPRRDFYALTELLHAIRDNTGVDLRESFPAWFKQFPLYDIISYYPAIYPAPENDYRIPSVKGAEPDLAAATLSRAAELAMVGFDNNALENQYLQGWAMHDRFILRSPLGAPYEFLWANPYQPGLSYFTLPLLFHDALAGRMFARSRWDDGAFWLGLFDGELQTFSEGEPRITSPTLFRTPVYFGDAVVMSGKRLQVRDEAKMVLVVGLLPSKRYGVEPDGEELREEISDRGGILELTFPTGFRGGIRIAELH